MKAPTKLFSFSARTDQSVSLQQPLSVARAGQDTSKDEALARQLQQEVNGDSSARLPANTSETDLALARRLQEEYTRGSSRGDPHILPGLPSGNPSHQCWHSCSNQRLTHTEIRLDDQVSVREVWHADKGHKWMRLVGALNCQAQAFSVKCQAGVP